MGGFFLESRLDNHKPGKCVGNFKRKQITPSPIEEVLRGGGVDILLNFFLPTLSSEKAVLL
jgi:hypothetical protein